MAPSSFGDRAYWDARYEKRSDGFDWLLPATCMDDHITRAIKVAGRPSPRILHLGCGTSTLSYHLRKFVERPEQIHNVDFSGPAIEVCRVKEKELFGAKGDGVMEWSVLDLLLSEQIVQLASHGDRTPPYDVVVDKSTCDSVCCADDLPIPPASLIRAGHPSTIAGPESHEGPVTKAIHPLDLLGIHIAYLTPPGTQWVALSYSKDRFEEWFDAKASPPQWIRGAENCLPHPSRLWELKSWEAIPVKQEDGKAGTGIHQPEILDYVYVLVRTDVPLVGGTQQ